MHNYNPSCIQLLKRDFGKFTSYRTFGVHNLVHCEPFWVYLYELRHLLSALGSDKRKMVPNMVPFWVHIYIFRPKLLQWNFLQISQLSIRSGAHKLFRRFLDFSQFLTAISRKLWHHLATNTRTMQCISKGNPIWKKCWKPSRNRPINGNAMLVRTMHPSNSRCSGLGAWQKKTN